MSVKRGLGDTRNPPKGAKEAELPSSWSYSRLGDIVDIRYGKMLPTVEFTETGYPVFGANGIIGNYSQYLYEEQKVLISCRGAYSGAINLSPPLCFITNNSLVLEIRDSKQISREYLFYALHTVDKSQLVTGSAQPQVTINNAVVLCVPIAPFQEQKRIVAEIEKQFTRLEAGTAALRRVQANLKRYRAAVLKAACEGRLVSTEAELAKTEKRKAKFETGEQLLARILKERREKWAGRGKYQEPAMPDSSSVTPLPQGWNLACLAQLAAHITDGTHKTPIYVTDGVPFLSAKDISGFRISFDNCRFISQSEHEMLRKRCAVRRGNVLITKSGTIGRVAVVETDQEFSLFESVANIPVISPIEPKYISFASFVAVSGTFGAANQKGVAVRHLHLEDLRRVPIPLPPLAEQTRIVAEVERRLSVIEGLEAMVAANLQRAARLRQAVLQRAFSGQL